MTNKKIADKIVKEMQDAGLTGKQILKIIGRVRDMFEQMKREESKKPD